MDNKIVKIVIKNPKWVGEDMMNIVKPLVDELNTRVMSSNTKLYTKHGLVGDKISSLTPRGLYVVGVIGDSSAYTVYPTMSTLFLTVSEILDFQIADWDRFENDKLSNDEKEITNG